MADANVPVWHLRRSTARTSANPRAAALYEREGLRVVGSEPAKLLMRSSP